MNCADFEAQVVALALDALDPTEREHALDHALDCTRCAELLGTEIEAEAQLKDALRAPIPSGLEALIKDRLAEQAQTLKLPSRPARWPWMVIAAAAMLAVGLWAGLHEAPNARAVAIQGQTQLAATGQVRLLGSSELGTSALAIGDRVTTGPEAQTVLEVAGALIWLDPNTEVVIGALDRDFEAPLTLRRGRLHVTVGPGKPFSIRTQHATVTANAGAFTLDEGPPMNPKALALALGAAGAATALFIAVQSGDVSVANANGKTTVASGQRAAVSSDSAPRRLSKTDTGRVAALEEELATLRRAQRGERAEIKRLKARVGVLSKANAEPSPDVELRPMAEVRTDLAALMKGEGLKLMALSKDHPLFKELVAMGPAGIDLLGEMLKTGDQNERFGAAALMEKLRDPAAISALEDAIFSGDNADNVLVQRMASHALGKIGGDTAVPVLERVVAEGSEWGVRTNAAYSLAEMGRKSGIDWLRESYQTQEDATAKMALLGAMGQIGDPSYLPDLHEVLQTETEYSKRYLAVMGIAKAARQESLPVLESIINNPDEDKMIINEAKKAYDEINPED